MSYFRKGLMR